jgi:hypothetical protein
MASADEFEASKQFTQSASVISSEASVLAWWPGLGTHG